MQSSLGLFSLQWQEMHPQEGGVEASLAPANFKSVYNVAFALLPSDLTHVGGCREEIGASQK
jgi:hypothetical protein